MFKTHQCLSTVLSAVLLLLTACTLPAGSSTGATLDDDGAPPTTQSAVENMRNLLGRQLRIDPVTIIVVHTETVEWPDTCLGLMQPTESCVPASIPGYKITFDVDGGEYAFHTYGDGYRFRIAAAPEPTIGELLMAWGGTFDNGECMEAIIGREGVAFGMCGNSPKIGGKFVGDARIAVLDEWVSTYTAFDAETDFGSVRLVGNGSASPSPDEQQMIGRWAQMAAMEAAAGENRAGMSYHGPAEMGSPDTTKCASLLIGASSEVGLGACDDILRSVDLGDRAYAEWGFLRDRFAPFVYENESEKVVFEGMGSMAGEPWQRAILAWARARHAELSTGKASAAVNTAMSWHLGQDFGRKNVCMHLTVLDYGYAYTEEFMCEGLAVINRFGDWLTSDDNYIDGKGSQEMDAAEIADANVWAMDVGLRILAAGQPLNHDSTADSCPERKDELGRVRDYSQGFDWPLFDTRFTYLCYNSAWSSIVREDLFIGLVNPGGSRLMVGSRLALEARRPAKLLWHFRPGILAHRIWRHQNSCKRLLLEAGSNVCVHSRI